MRTGFWQSYFRRQQPKLSCISAVIAGFLIVAQCAAMPDRPVSHIYGKLPLSFEANRGQFDSEVAYSSRGPGYALFLTKGETVLVLRGTGRALDVLRTRLVGANRNPRIAALDEMAGRANYFIGNDPREWRTNVPLFGKIKYRRVYPGIDLVYYGREGLLEYDFVVAPGADPRRIQLSFDGCDDVEIDHHGRLVLRLPGGEVHWDAPRIYQERKGVRRSVAGNFVRSGPRQVSFAVAEYDRTQSLIIDPLLLYSTYLGGDSDDVIYGIAADSSGHVYVTGETTSSNFPKKNPLQQNFSAPSEAFVTKIGPVGTNLVYSTYLGGNNSDAGFAIAVDASTNVVVAGFTDSNNFPTRNAYQSGPRGFADAFVVKLNAAGSMLTYGTYLGGADDDVALGVAVDSSGRIHVTGNTSSTNFPAKNAYKSTFQGGIVDAFVSRLDPALSGSASLLYSTYLGGDSDEEGHAVAVDGSARTYVTGNTSSTNFPVTAGVVQTNLQSFFVDAFVTKLNTANSGASSLTYSTYLGGTNSENLFAPGSLTVDASSNVFVVGSTGSTNFPVTTTGLQTNYGGGFTDGFVVKLSSTATAILYGSYLGGTEEDSVRDVAVDSQSKLHLAGATGSADFSVTAGAFQLSFGGGVSDAFLVKLDPAVAGQAGLISASYLGGTADDAANGIAIASPTNVFIAGETSTNGFPVTAGAVFTNWAGGFEGFIARVVASAEAGLTVASPGVVQIGTDYSYTLTVTNKGELAASGMAVTNRLGSLVNFLSAIPSQGSCTHSGGVVTCNLGTLPAFQGASITISVHAPTPGMVTNSTQLRLNEPDPVLTNNLATNITVVGALVTVTPQIPDAAEPGTTGRFLIARMGSTQFSLTVNYSVGGTATANGDYVALTGFATINSGSFGRTVTVTPIDDAQPECDETVVLTIEPGAGYAIGSPDAAVVTLNDDEPPPVSVVASTPDAAELGAVPGQFTISRYIDNTNVEVTVNFILGGTSLNGIDYSNIVTSVVMPLGAASVNIPVIPILDAAGESNETVSLTLSSGAGYTVVPPDSAMVTIADSPYGLWLYAFFGGQAGDPGIGGEAADPDGDGIPNLLEFALNLDPTIPDLVGLPTAAFEDGFLTLTYRVNKQATEVIFTVEVSSDLPAGWNSGPAHTAAPVLISDDGSTQTFKVSDLTPVSALEQRAIRLRVTH